MSQMQASGALTPEAFYDAIDRINSRLSEEQRQALQDRLQVEAVILKNIENVRNVTDSALTELTPTEPPLTEPAPAEPVLAGTTPTESALTDPDPPPPDSAPETQDSIAQTPDSNLQPATCNLQPSDNLQPSTRDLRLRHISRSLSKLKRDPREIIPFRDVIQELIDSSYLPIDQVIEDIRWRVRHATPDDRILVDQAIRDFLNPPPPDALRLRQSPAVSSAISGRRPPTTGRCH